MILSKTNIISMLGFLMSACLFVACQKESPVVPLKKPDRGQTSEDLLKDSVYYYTDYFYLWQDQLPEWGSFFPEKYKTAEEVLEALKLYAKDANGKPIDRYSFLDRTGAVNESIQEGYSGSFGFDVRFNNDEDLFVKLVYPNSPAYKAGIKRGWQVIEINGNRNLGLASFEADDFSFLFNALNAPVIDLKLLTDERISVSIQLQRSTFQIKPILYDHIYTIRGKKIGYFVFESFVSVENAAGSANYVRHDLDRLFSQFESEGVSEVILDLRYNGGGAVVTVEYLSNMLAPYSADKQLMYSYTTNDELEADGWKEVLFEPVNFQKTNTLNINRLYFLVTAGSTASASELLINNLEPFLDVKLIGEKHTYGKPVGFFPWEIMGVDLYAVSFKTTNNRGDGDYFNGIPVHLNIADDVSKNWGDLNDGMLKQALYYAENGSFLQSPSLQLSRKVSRPLDYIQNLNRKLDQQGNHNMFLFNKRPEFIKNR